MSIWCRQCTHVGHVQLVYITCEPWGIHTLRCEIPVLPWLRICCMWCARDLWGLRDRTSYPAVAWNNISEDKKFCWEGNRADVFVVLKRRRDRRFNPLYEGIRHFELGARWVTSSACFRFVLHIWFVTRTSCDALGEEALLPLLSQTAVTEFAEAMFWPDKDWNG